MKRLALILGGIFLLTIIWACGPSPEQVATMTASAWTATPPPTATPVPPTITPSPTPVPYDLNVSVMDQTGAPLAGASIVFPESGSKEAALTDDSGKFSWKNLASDTVTLKVSAQGFIPSEQTATLKRGLSEISVTMQQDPFGLLPSAACLSGEKLLYAEDFQDKHAQGWNEIDLKTPGWDMLPADDEAGNIILSAKYDEMLGDQGLNSRLMNGMSFDNAVWRIRFKLSGRFEKDQIWFSFNWRNALEPFDLNGQQIFDSRYQLPLGANGLGFRRLQQPVTNIGIGGVSIGPKAGEWHLVEIPTFQNVTDVWLDGKRLMSYEDPQPLPPGTMGLELHLKGSKVVVYFDNISVCELSAPFTSIAPAKK